MTCKTHTTQIDLRFGDAVRQFLYFGAGVRPDKLARERFHVFGKGRIRRDELRSAPCPRNLAERSQKT
jgi:hypothetical protein